MVSVTSTEGLVSPVPSFPIGGAEESFADGTNIIYINKRGIMLLHYGEQTSLLGQVCNALWEGWGGFGVA